MLVSIETEARAFMIWRYAKPREWDCTVAELAEVLNLTQSSVRHVLTRKGWLGRVHRDLGGSSNRRALGVSGNYHARGFHANIDELPLDQLLR